MQLIKVPLFFFTGWSGWTWKKKRKEEHFTQSKKHQKTDKPKCWNGESLWNAPVKQVALELLHRSMKAFTWSTKKKVGEGSVDCNYTWNIWTQRMATLLGHIFSNASLHFVLKIWEKSWKDLSLTQFQLAIILIVFFSPVLSFFKAKNLPFPASETWIF